jgi:glycosyltransferase involved in cell wall biosynthesis
MNESIQLSIVVPVFAKLLDFTNLENWLRKLNNNRIEVIVVHDKADEQDDNYFEKFIESFKNYNIKLIHKYAGNPGTARNLGKKLASGKWIVFCDADDVVDTERLYSAIPYEVENRIFVFQYRVFEYNKNKLLYSSSDLTLSSLSSNPGIWRIAFPKDLIQDIDFPELRMGEDQVFLARVFLKDLEVEFKSIFTYSYFKGVTDQLTENQVAIQDLITSNNLILGMYSKKMSENSRKFLLELLSRQCLTIFSRISVKQGVIQILRIFFSNPKNTGMKKIIVKKIFTSVFGKR